MTPERAELVSWSSRLGDAEHTPNKTVCTSKVAEKLGVTARYFHTLEDIIRAARRKGYSIHTRRDNIPFCASLRRVRRAIATELASRAGDCWLIRWEDKKGQGHVLLVDRKGRTIVDTAPGCEHNVVTDLYRIRKKVI